MVPPTPASGPTDLAGTITDSKGGPSLSSLNSGTQAIPALGLPAPVTGTAATTQSSSAPAAPHSLSMLAMKQNEPAIVKNLVLFIVFLCDRVVTNILSFEAVLPFLLMALRAAEKSTTQMCDASADQAMSASARKDLNSTTLRITAGQLIRSQILRVVVILLSLQEPSPSLLEHILIAVKATMQRDHEPRQLDELMRVLYTAFKTPPVRHFEQVQLLLAAIWQFIHNTCALSPRFKKATTLKGLTQVLSLTKEIGAACTGGTAADVRVRLELLFRERREDLDSVFSARPKSKFDDAVRREHRMKKDYQEHIPAIASARKIFRTPFSTALVVTESYWSLYGSMADALEPVSHHNAHWLYFTNNAVHGTPYDEERYRLASVESFRVLSKKRKNTVLVSEPIPMVTVTGEDNDDDDDSDGDDGADVDLFGATIYPSSSALLGGSGVTFQLPPLDVESLTTANATPLTATDAATTGGGVCTPLSNGAVAILGVTPGKLKQRHYYDTARNYVPFLLAVDDEEDGEGDCTLRAAARSASIVDASVCEEMTSVMSVFCPAFICRCPPIPMRDDHNRMFHPECTTHFTDSARFLLRYLLSPGERVRHICNAFRVDGIHSTPCVVILTDAMLKVYASARITGHGDILIGGDELLEEVDLEEDIAVSASSSSSHLTTHHASLPKSSGLTPKGSPTAALKRGGLSTSFRGLEKFARRTTQRIQNRVKSIFTGTERKRIRGSRLARSLHASVHGSTSAMRGLCWFYYNNNITKLQKVQYMHQDCALLVSLAHDNGPLLAIMDDSQSLNNTARDQFYSVIKKILVSSQIAGNVAFLDEVSKKPLLEVATERWVHRSCSTYEYLLTLNSIANRVRKDWNQYPVFPWVLKNYTSGTTLDLNAADNYRDLSWPIGAQLEQRREELKVRYDTLQETSQQERLDYEAENPGSNTGASGTSTLLNVIISRVEEVATGMPSESTGAGPLGVRTYPFHHGSHYSSSAGVLHYLIRTEPFTTRSKIYQGGSFDHPDRLFHSVQDSFYSCTHSSADCKELIPEFYSRGQFLANEDGRKFGARQDGRVVDAVTLPPWAQGSPHVFVAVMRMALESEHVSQRLHKWIDLVFGVRQQGKLSIESFNVFQRFSYGEEVLRALGATHSIQECKAIVSEVENFGQTPVQVFTDAPHPQRRNAAFRQPSSAVVSASSSISSAAALSATGALGDTQAALYDTGSLAGTVDQGSLTSSTLGTTVLTSTTNGGAPAFPEEAPLDATTTPLEDLGLSSTITARPTTLQVLFTHAQRYTMEEDLATVTYHATTATTQVAQLEDTNSGRGGIVFVPPPPSQTSRFILADPASGTFTQPHHNMVARFAGATRNTKPIVSIVPLADGKLFADTDQMRLIPETDLCLCWYKHEERLLRYRVSTGEFHSAVQFEIPEGHEEMEITSVVACRREVFLCLGTSSGTIYCLHPDSIRSWCVLGTTLCVHTNPIRFMVASERLSRLVSVTNNINDPPIVWRIQRLLVAKLHHLPMDLVTPETDRLVTGVCMCPREGNTFVSTTRRVAVFDSDGTPWGVGKLPSPADAESTVLTVFADITSMHQFLTSDWCDGRVAVLTGHTDGSIGLWCIRRNPPSSIAPHAIVSVKFVRLVAPAHPAAFGYPTTFRQPVEGTPHIFIGYSSGLLRELRFEESFLVAGNNSVAGQASGATGSSAAQK
ncbi:Hypothetical protein, putative [Bodo saltans]|uniref:BEACH domain-containing protein n=1 Tax=Bodo saltans TaxID=75058 RepID=A0A0S4JU10_BODSA|nr:Hypothetical protein, putative [Bodo saltans]|eukprot:CUG92603.1 Hypothetical protein, putative [Bodo saltans]